MEYLSRRRFLCGSLGLASAGMLAGCGVPLPGRQPPRVARIGVLSQADANDVDRIGPFREGLRELGYVEGQNLVIEWRFADGKADRLPGLAAELAQLPVDVLVSLGATPAAQAARQASDTIPVVFVGVGDPVGSGLVASLARPGGHVTGMSNFLAATTTKRVELLAEALPGISRIDVIMNPANPAVQEELARTQEAARALGLRSQPRPVRGAEDFEGSFAAMAGERPDAVILLGDAVYNSHVARLARLALANRLPAMFPFREFAVAGGLMTYGNNLADIFRRGAYFVDKILKGTNPAELPVEQPTKFDFVINLQTARTLGLTIPHSVLQQATEIIQ